MDIDAFITVHEPDWVELESLASRSNRLSGVEADRLVTLYQRTSSQLAQVHSQAPDPYLIARLSNTLSKARLALAGVGESPPRELSRFFLVSFPAALWRIRWWTFWVALSFIAVATAIGWYIATNPEAQAALMSDEQAYELVTHDFVNYYSENPAASFAARVWTNNALIAAACVAFGIFGFVVPYILMQNATSIGAVGGLMFAHDKGDVFFAYLLPHGLLEITAVFVAAAAGLKIFWTVIDPGPMPRSQAVAREGRALLSVALGLIVVLAISGVIEAGITPSGLPTFIRIAIGVIALGAFFAYAGILGRRATRLGFTGDLRREHQGDVEVVAG